MHDNIKKSPTELPKNVIDYIQDIARPLSPIEPMENRLSESELCLEHLVLVDHGKAF